MANPTGATVNGFVGGAAGVVGVAAMGVAIANPLPTAIIVGAGATYAYVSSDATRASINEGAKRTYEVIAENVADANNPRQGHNGAHRVANFVVATGIALSIATANPTFAYAGAALGAAAETIRAKERGQCVIL